MQAKTHLITFFQISSAVRTQTAKTETEWVLFVNPRRWHLVPTREHRFPNALGSPLLDH